MANESVKTTVDVTAQLIDYRNRGITEPVVDNEGQPVRGEDGQIQLKPVTLRDVATTALVNNLRGDDNMPPDRKKMSFSLAVRINSQDNPSFTAEELAFLDDRIGRAYAPGIVGPASMLLNPASVVS